MKNQEISDLIDRKIDQSLNVVADRLRPEIWNLAERIEKLEASSERFQQRFHNICQVIIDNQESRALNYCVPYARHGLKCKTKREIHVQGIYMLSNMTHWRGPIAKQVREDLKAIIKETE